MLVKNFAVNSDAYNIVVVEISFEVEFKLGNFLGVEGDLIGKFTLNIESKLCDVTGSALAKEFVAISDIVFARYIDAKNGVSIGQREGIAAVVPEEEQAVSIPRTGRHGIDVTQIRAF